MDVRQAAIGVGIDVEVDRIVRSAAARFYLTDAEQATATRIDLLRLWTVKEALFKADPGNRGRPLTAYRLDGTAALAGAGHAAHDAGQRMRYATVPLPGGFLTAAVSFGSG
jgi:hypothetical protein